MIINNFHEIIITACFRLFPDNKILGLRFPVPELRLLVRKFLIAGFTGHLAKNLPQLKFEIIFEISTFNVIPKTTLSK